MRIWKRIIRQSQRKVMAEIAKLNAFGRITQRPRWKSFTQGFPDMLRVSEKRKERRKEKNYILLALVSKANRKKN